MNLSPIEYSIRLKIWVFCLLIPAVLSLPAQNAVDLKPFSDGVAEDILYDTQMRYKDFSFTGFLAVKSEPSGYHVYLISKTGFTLVEAIIKEKETEWIKTMPFVDKPNRKKKLETDFRLLTQSPLKFGAIKRHTKKGLKIKMQKGGKVFFTIENKVITAGQTKGIFKFIKTKIRFQSPDSNGLPQSIDMRKTMLDADIKLKLHEN